MLVEEAGQVLEAHILGSLVPSVEHMILIGDPLQLRPTLNNYGRLPSLYRGYLGIHLFAGLSMDSKQGSQLFRFDMSLMERLSSSGFPMSQIDVQRRMRPSISSLIRYVPDETRRVLLDSSTGTLYTQSSSTMIWSKSILMFEV